jgi:hypothetical protein
MKNFTRLTLLLLTVFMFPFIGSISTANGQQLDSLGAHCGATHMNNEKKRMKKEVKCLRRALHENLPGVKLRQSKDGLGAYGCGVKKTGSKPAQIACLRGLLNAPQRGGPAAEKSATDKAAAIARCMDVVPPMGNLNEMTQYCGSEGWENILKCNSWRCSAEKSAAEKAKVLTRVEAISNCVSFHGANDDFTKQLCGDSYNECLSDSSGNKAVAKACDDMHGSPLK